MSEMLHLVRTTKFERDSVVRTRSSCTNTCKRPLTKRGQLEWLTKRALFAKHKARALEEEEEGAWAATAVLLFPRHKRI